jgi:hypothetical protein
LGIYPDAATGRGNSQRFADTSARALPVATPRPEGTPAGRGKKVGPRGGSVGGDYRDRRKGLRSVTCNPLSLLLILAPPG